MQRLTGRLHAGRQFGQQHRGHRGVFVPGVAADQISVRLFAAEHEIRRPKFVDHAADVLEADLQVAEHADAEGLGDPPHQIGSDKRLDEIRIGGQSVSCCSLLEQIIGQNRTDLVAGHRTPGTSRLRGQRGGQADAVAVGIGGQHQIGPYLPGPFDDDVEHLGVFGIGNMARHVRKIAVRFGVRAKQLDVVKTVGRQDG